MLTWWRFVKTLFWKAITSSHFCFRGILAFSECPILYPKDFFFLLQFKEFPRSLNKIKEKLLVATKWRFWGEVMVRLVNCDFSIVRLWIELVNMTDDLTYQTNLWWSRAFLNSCGIRRRRLWEDSAVGAKNFRQVPMLHVFKDKPGHYVSVSAKSEFSASKTFTELLGKTSISSFY